MFENFKSSLLKLPALKRFLSYGYNNRNTLMCNGKNEITNGHWLVMFPPSVPAQFPIVDIGKGLLFHLDKPCRVSLGMTDVDESVQIPDFERIKPENNEEKVSLSVKTEEDCLCILASHTNEYYILEKGDKNIKVDRRYVDDLLALQKMSLYKSLDSISFEQVKDYDLAPIVVKICPDFSCLIMPVQ